MQKTHVHFVRIVVTSNLQRFHSLMKEQTLLFFFFQMKLHIHVKVKIKVDICCKVTNLRPVLIFVPSSFQKRAKFKTV